MRKADYIFLAFFLLINTIFALSTDVYLNSEQYGYWYFNKIFLDGFIFPDLSRSPLYIVYLSLFNWLQFPYNMATEAGISNFIACTSLFFLFKNKLKNIFIFLTLLFSLGFFYNMIPHPQALAFSCANFAIYFRQKNNDKYLFISYLLLISSIFFRVTYLVVFFLFIFIDIIKIIINYKNKELLKQFTSILIVLLIFFSSLHFFKTRGTESKFDNGYFNDLTWSPTKSKSNIDIAFILNFNYLYIEKNSDNLLEREKDFYFTNKILFNDAQTIQKALINNPSFFTWGIFKNLFHIPPIIVNKFFLRNFLPECSKGHSCLSNYFFITFGICVVLLGLFFFFIKKHLKRKSINEIMNDHLLHYAVANLFLISIVVLALPKLRYMMPFLFFLIPINIFFYNLLLKKILNRKLMYFFTIIFILFFSFFNMNIPIFKNIYYSILKNSYFYNLKSFNEDIVLLDREIRTCKSTLVTSPTLILGFTDYNEKKLKTFFQIPPFGKYEGNSLNLTDKIFIDCILFNKGFEKTLGANRGVGPNYQLRRENYLFPFMSQNNSKIYQQINFKKIGSLIKYNE
jgi:hypothetical protein